MFLKGGTITEEIMYENWIKICRRSFPVAAPTVWNSLPAHLRSTLISRRQFRDGLKSHLFADAYFWSSENIRYKSVMYLLTYLLTY